jgi:hypothetical protein
VKRITRGSVKTFEELTIRMEDLRDVVAIFSQTVRTTLESVMLKTGYDEDLAREWVPMSLFPGSVSWGNTIIWVCTLTCGKWLPPTVGNMLNYNWNSV